MYVQETSIVDSAVIGYGGGWCGPTDLAENTNSSEDMCLAVSVLGALLLCIVLSLHF